MDRKDGTEDSWLSYCVFILCGLAVLSQKNEEDKLRTNGAACR